MTFGMSILFCGILFFITPIAMAWSKFDEISEESLVKLMMNLNFHQIQMLKTIQQTGISFIFIGSCLALIGY